MNFEFCLSQICVAIRWQNYNLAGIFLWECICGQTPFFEIGPMTLNVKEDSMSSQLLCLTSLLSHNYCIHLAKHKFASSTL